VSFPALVTEGTVHEMIGDKEPKEMESINKNGR
jgi:hypothetical protein